jgi:hypothetical protein
MTQALRRRELGGLTAAVAGGLLLDGSDALARTIDRSTAEAYRKPTPGSPIDTGGALIGIHATMDEVRRVLQRFDRYHRILPRVEQSHIVGKTKKHTDVYMRAPILRGVAHIWMVVRFREPTRWGHKGEKLVGRYVKGNLDGWRGAWRMYPCSSTRTVLRLELFVDLSMPVPSSMVTPELMWAARKGVTAVRDMVECGRSTVTKD